MRVNIRSLAWIGLLAALGGGINAALCLSGWPVPPEDIGDTVFRWHLIPAGAIHGALLAVLAMLSVAIAKKIPTFVQWMMVPIVGLLAGWVAFIPLNLSLVDQNRNISVLWSILKIARTEFAPRPASRDSEWAGGQNEF